jgi:hypothetical protein
VTVRVSSCPSLRIPPCRRYDVFSAGLNGAGGAAVGVESAESMFAYWRIIRMDGTLAASVAAQAVEVFGSGDDSLPCLISSGTLSAGKGGLTGSIAHWNCRSLFAIIRIFVPAQKSFHFFRFQSKLTLVCALDRVYCGKQFGSPSSAPERKNSGLPPLPPVSLSYL